MFGFGYDDVAFLLLGAVGAALLAALATSNKRICERLNEIAETCREYHDKKQSRKTNKG